jgi:hypothetical protein
LFSVSVASDPYVFRAQLRSSSMLRSSTPFIAKKQGRGRTPKPMGYRVLSSDVCAFTASDSEPHTVITEASHFIPLVSPFPPSPSTSRSPSPTNVKFLSLLQPSPYRSRDTPPHLVYRMRPISNPVLLRLRALQNVLEERGKEWEGRGRDGGLGCGRERVLGVAFEGRGRSGLGCELRVGVF